MHEYAAAAIVTPIPSAKKIPIIKMKAGDESSEE